MKFSCICLTYGRPAQLAEAVACFLSQDYTDSEIVVVNTMPQQTLELPPNDRIQVVNLKTRPTSLGAARNIAVAHARGDILVTWDDDDFYGLHHLSNFAPFFTPGIHWVWQPRQFYCEGNKIKAVVPGTVNVVAFTKTAFDGAGKYREMNCGEDRDFVGRLTSGFKGMKIQAEDFAPSFFYCWGNGVYHVSGLGDDKPGQPSSWQRAEKSGLDKLRRGLLKHGRVTILPAMKRDLSQMLKDYALQTRALAPTQRQIAVVLLGRYGDIINILPILRLIAENYAKPHLMVSQEFASVLDGVSYVQPFPVAIPNNLILPAIKLAEERFPNYLLAQIWSEDHEFPRTTPAYNVESWHQAGFGWRFPDPDLFPVFDRRNTAREEALFNKLNVKGRPMLLLMLSGGISSPFNDEGRVFALLNACYDGEYAVVNLAELRAERIFDLVGLIERAAALVSIDTSLLHLAPATGTPFIALVNPANWLGTHPRGNCVARLTYNEAIANPNRVLKAVEIAIGAPRRCLPAQTVTFPPRRRMFHAVERHEEPPDRRKEEAQATWDAVYGRGVIPVHVWKYPRTATDIGDKRALPYLRDIIQPALDQAVDDDIVFFTNDDNALHPELVDILEYHVSVFGPCCSQRIEFRGKPIPPRKIPPAQVVKLGGRHMGRDLFAATKSWWIKALAEMGDPILGASDWDLHLCCVVRNHYGIETSRQNIEEHLHPAEIPLGYVMHKFHPPRWAHKTNVDSAPSQKHNRQTFRDWADKHMPSLKFHPGNVI